MTEAPISLMDVVIREVVNSDGTDRVIALRLEPDATIQAVKDVIAQRFGVPQACQQLRCSGRLANNMEVLSDLAAGGLVRLDYTQTALLVPQNCPPAPAAAAGYGDQYYTPYASPAGASSSPRPTGHQYAGNETQDDAQIWAGDIGYGRDIEVMRHLPSHSFGKSSARGNSVQFLGNIAEMPALPKKQKRRRIFPCGLGRT